MPTSVESDNTFTRRGLVLVEETKAMSKFVENDVAFIIGGHCSIGSNVP